MLCSIYRNSKFSDRKWLDENFINKYNIKI
jgi:hypothetical protein